MAPKRKAASAKGKRQKKVKAEVEPEVPPAVDKVTETRKALKTEPGSKAKAKIDSACNLANKTGLEVHEDYDCMLNQTNIGHNNNKFYIIQLIAGDGKFYTWTRWGRVGEGGQNAMKTFGNEAEAIKDFEKKFKDKTKNNWQQRGEFTAHPGKYTLIEMQYEDDEEEGEKPVVSVDIVDGSLTKKVIKPCSLPKQTQDLMSLIFSNDMFKDAMKEMNLDVKKMPLGKLSKAQIGRGFDALEAIEEALRTAAGQRNLESLSSTFFTIIPHNFGRMRPPVINSQEIIRNKKDMLLVLADIVLAQSLQADKDRAAAAAGGEGDVGTVVEVPHPLNADYDLLKCELELLGEDSHELAVIKQYVSATAPSYMKVNCVWKVNREGECERFKAHEELSNRRLLWHGTNIAVVAAILKSGLRIMPHSGGRVGCGIYFASQNEKSAQYMGYACDGRGVMFLNEVVLGNEFTITKDDSSLKQAPAGYNSVVARGHVEPDPKKDVTLELDGKQVTVPQGRPVQVAKFKQSNFSHSEYLVYNENQCRIRYLLLVSNK
ncbi:protein mono-ADP-ribosyltransferase PARP3 isoform X2 [Lethenteron reissneri]|nr:protein mono-ADP-ribosyltransferase PARP3 isoform X2 [Lethenteron reissneri]XP_061423028.1 protein mono-ADP-ribosyltransferase PARP3 isoform X2 [Lethenteron reissneri]